MAKGKEKITKGELELKSLKVELTEAEILAYSRQLAKANQDEVQIEARLKEVKDDFKHQSSKVIAEIGMLSSRINSGEEYREVECRWEYNWHKGEKRLIREDTGEVIGEQVITDYERQEQIKLDDEVAA